MNQPRTCFVFCNTKNEWREALFHWWSTDSDGDPVAIFEEKESGELVTALVQLIRFQPPEEKKK